MGRLGREIIFLNCRKCLQINKTFFHRPEMQHFGLLLIPLRKPLELNLLVQGPPVLSAARVSSNRGARDSTTLEDALAL
jgi:hypothetical protein